ncbi:carbohydrate ABC transporter membrane protein 1, CUT1 family [Rubellimicrobium thermophilum DSM 16684]|uniref:Carbohydrate ABC transporter membrane protein 1, CUT1 family n=1 Tax=Rubellimicrobium thermophilum DSM 16684 TaxID=1123069 RepID=S9SCB3_9RHOB|nr:sugar ABC transporter permease [Rubellimicrobium thermophilum]EPX87760.1 carbohydrate ABC transporter membrane protein 1, CUT1 family [Rubellimicrobium thermophilum DSM 16684]
MLTDRRKELIAALVLITPFLVIYGWMFVWPTIQMVTISFTNAPLIGKGDWIGLDNYRALLADPVFHTALWNTSYFVILTVVPGTAVALLIALMVSRLRGWLQSLVLALFFLPFILPVTVVYVIWDWLTNVRFGLLQGVIEPLAGRNVNVWRTLPWFMPGVALITIWWTNGFSILLFLAGLRNIPRDLYEAASLDGATRWQLFTRITWPLIWPVTVLCLTIQLILQLKIFDQVYLFAQGGRTRSTMVMVQYIYETAFQRNQGGYAATVAVMLFIIVAIFSVLQFQLLRMRGAR